MPLRKMSKFPFLFYFFLFAPLVFGLMMDHNGKGRIGAIVDMSSRIGKEEVVAMHMAVEDFNSFTNKSFSLVIRDSKNDPNLASLAAKDLISIEQVQILIGPQTWEAASAVAKVGSDNQIPVLALANEIPNWANERFKFLVQASPSQIDQMRVIAGIIGLWDWRLVNVIYEATELSTREIFPNLVHALRDVEAKESEFVALSPFDCDSFSKELERLKRGSRRVFVVHMSFKLTLHLFKIAKEMGMMEKEYVWITTDSFTSLAHSFNVSINSMLQGIVGVKSFFPKQNDPFREFDRRFNRRFRLEHSNEDNYEPGIFAVQAYDAARAAAMAMSENQEKGHHLLDRIKLTNFQGLGGKIQFKDRKLSPASTFQLINVFERSYKELGFWSDKLGFSKKLGDISNSNLSRKDLVQVYWPGEPSETPRGWALPTVAKQLKIGVSTGSMFKQYINVEEDATGKNPTLINGLTIDLFTETLKNLRFNVSYRFVPFPGSYDELVEKIFSKYYDAALGTAVISERYKYAEFTQPFTESGLVMIVPTTKDTSNRKLLFTKPFTWAMWILIAVFNVYNGFVVWFIERTHYPDRDGSMFDQVGTMVCSSFTTLFSLHGNMLHSNLSRMTMVVWLFVALVITQIYTANLTTMLTIQKLEPTIMNIETLQRRNALVGYGKGSYVRTYLEEVLHFRAENIRNYSTPDAYVEALRKKEIAAGFLQAPYAKILLARFCTEFMTSGPTYKVGGFAFAFPRGSPMLMDMNEALLKITESGTFRDLESNMIANVKCEDGNEKGESSSQLDPNSFYVLFLLSGGVSTIAITLYMFKAHSSSFKQNLMIVVMRHWGNQTTRFSRRLREEPQTVSKNFLHVTNLQIQV